MIKTLTIASKFIAIGYSIMRYLEKRHIENEINSEIIRKEYERLTRQYGVRDKVVAIVDAAVANGELFDTDEFERK